MLGECVLKVIVGSTALVNGASSGLGEHFGRVLASDGAHVILAARHLNRIESLAVEIVDRDSYAMALVFHA